MTKETAKKTSTKVAVIETLPIIKFDVTKAAITKLKKQCAMFKKAPTNPTDYSKLTKQLALVRTTRTSIEHRRKELKAPLIKFGKEVDGLAKTLTTQLQEMETPLVNLKMEADAAKLKAKREKELAEQKRLAALAGGLDKIRGHVLAAMQPGVTPEMVAQSIEDIEAEVINKDSWQEMTAVAEVTRQETLMKLRQQKAALDEQRLEDDRRQLQLVELETQREAQAKVKAEQEATQAKLEKQQKAIDDQAKEAQEKIDQAAREVAEKEAAENRAAQEKEAAAKLKKEAKAQARKHTKWKKEVLADVPVLEAYLASLDEITQPIDQVKTQEAANVLVQVRLVIEEGQLQVSGLKTYGESDE